MPVQTVFSSHLLYATRACRMGDFRWTRLPQRWFPSGSIQFHSQFFPDRTPFRGVGTHNFRELVGRTGKGLVTLFDELFLHIGAEDDRVNLLLELVDDGTR